MIVEVKEELTQPSESTIRRLCEKGKDLASGLIAANGFLQKIGKIGKIVTSATAFGRKVFWIQKCNPRGGISLGKFCLHQRFAFEQRCRFYRRPAFLSHVSDGKGRLADGISLLATVTSNLRKCSATTVALMLLALLNP
jgi:hypothetical protein